MIGWCCSNVYMVFCYTQKYVPDLYDAICHAWMWNWTVIYNLVLLMWALISCFWQSSGTLLLIVGYWDCLCGVQAIDLFTGYFSWIVCLLCACQVRGLFLLHCYSAIKCVVVCQHARVTMTWIFLLFNDFLQFVSCSHVWIVPLQLLLPRMFLLMLIMFCYSSHFMLGKVPSL
jgi:hypothetical protein